MEAIASDVVEDQERLNEAAKLFASPPTLSASPTDSFWLHFDSPLNLSSLDSTPILSKPYSIVIIGAENDEHNIFGGGLTGISIAYWLTECGVPGSEILLLEARTLAGGATGRNGGHCWPSTRIWSKKLLALWGRENLEKAEEWKYNSAELFMTWLEENKIDCELLRTGCCALAKFEVEKEEYLEYLDDKKSRVESLRTTMGLWTPEECAERLFASKCTSGLYQSLAGQFWPRKAVFGIAQLVLSRGVNIRTNTCLRSVKRPQSTGGHFALDSDAGPITCHKLVHATNGYAASLIPQYKGILVPVRGQVVATSPVSSFWIPHNLSLNDGYEYLVHRKLDKRIIYGGMRWRAQTAGKEVGVCDDSTIDETVSECLKTSLIEIFPLLKNEPNFKIDYEWTGVMGYSCDNYPLIGQVEAGCDEWIAAGYSGNGMPQCFGAAKAVSEMITGRLPTGDKWIPLFNPRRFNNPEYASKYRYTGSKHLKMEE